MVISRVLRVVRLDTFFSPIHRASCPGSRRSGSGRRFAALLRRWRTRTYADKTAHTTAPAATATIRNHQIIRTMNKNTKRGGNVGVSFFRPFGAGLGIRSIPRACALGCILSPLRGWRYGSDEAGALGPTFPALPMRPEAAA